MQNKYLNMVILHISWLQLSGKIFFSENMMLLPDEKLKMVFLKKKKYTEIWYLLQIFWKYGLFKKDCAETWYFLYHLERRYFFSGKHGIFSLDGKRERGDLSQEIHGNMIFSNWYAPLQKKKKKIKDDPILQKYT